MHVWLYISNGAPAMGVALAGLEMYGGVNRLLYQVWLGVLLLQSYVTS